MSTELTRARQQLASIRTFLRQGKPQPAVQALHSTVLTVLKTPLMKSERDEFERLIEDSVYHLTADPQIKQLCPQHITYKPGQERELLDSMHSLLEKFDDTMRDEAEELMRLMEERRKNLLAEAAALFAEGKTEEAAKILRLLAQENKDDSALLGKIGEMFLQAGCYDEAIEFLESALEMSPELAHLYNKIGMALRKVSKFETAEKYYLKASAYLGRDPNLFFNLGRLYVDWGNWGKAIKAADAALKLEPDFAEARKMADYARKMQEKNAAK